MSPRSEYLAALLTANPDLIATTFLSLVLCAAVFLGSFILKNRDRFQHAASLPLLEDGLEENEKEKTDV